MKWFSKQRCFYSGLITWIDPQISLKSRRRQQTLWSVFWPSYARHGTLTAIIIKVKINLWENHFSTDTAMKKSDRIEVSIAWIQIGLKSESPKNHFLSLNFYYRESHIQPANAYLTQSEYQYEWGLYRMPSGSCIIFFLKTTHPWSAKLMLELCKWIGPGHQAFTQVPF